jgi:hypothetical protein
MNESNIVLHNMKFNIHFMEFNFTVPKIREDEEKPGFGSGRGSIS